ncbi:hypothetical protein BC940DRAFT_246399 [Gongronella butleri]|nr:hypothetical protein BC940DRAFT_246399 [Gongronella butleri]
MVADLSLSSTSLPLYEPTLPTAQPAPPVPPPPRYELGPSRKRIPIVEPREEEGNEILPAYECTVSRMGFLFLKKEMESPTKRARHRCWRKLYLVLWGTTIRAYKHIPKDHDVAHGKPKKPVWCYSMQHAEAGIASDYRKRHYVIRMRIHQGPQFIIRTKNEDDRLMWLEHIQASVNVSLDLDHRNMPQFVTSARRRRRARLTHDTASVLTHQRCEGPLI